MESKHARTLCSFFLLCFKTANRLASGSPVAWVRQAAPGVGAAAFCRLHCGFRYVIQKERLTNDKGRSAESNVKHHLT